MAKKNYKKLYKKEKRRRKDAEESEDSAWETYRSRGVRPRPIMPYGHMSSIGGPIPSTDGNETQHVINHVSNFQPIEEDETVRALVDIWLLGQGCFANSDPLIVSARYSDAVAELVRDGTLNLCPIDNVLTIAKKEEASEVKEKEDPNLSLERECMWIEDFVAMLRNSHTQPIVLHDKDTRLAIAHWLEIHSNNIKNLQGSRLEIPGGTLKTKLYLE
jgi:hypothetical protein